MKVDLFKIKARKKSYQGENELKYLEFRRSLFKRKFFFTLPCYMSRVCWKKDILR